MKKKDFFQLKLRKFATSKTHLIRTVKGSFLSEEGWQMERWTNIHKKAELIKTEKRKVVIRIYGVGEIGSYLRV